MPINIKEIEINTVIDDVDGGHDRATGPSVDIYALKAQIEEICRAEIERVLRRQSER